MKLIQVVLATLALASIPACSSDPEPHHDPLVTAPAPAASKDSDVDTVEVVGGVADHGRNPAVVAVMIGNEGLCSGTLIAKDVVLTARHCVAKTAEHVQCPADSVQVYDTRDPKTLGIITGDVVDGQTPVAYGREIIAPNGVTLCDADIALIVLDQEVRNIKPLGVSLKPLGQGAWVSSVGYGKRGDARSAGAKRFREHVPVVGITAAEFFVGESTCQGDSGGPALDASTGDVVGVVSRGGPSCEGSDAHNIYTRTDAFSWLVDEALKRSGPETSDGEHKGAPRASGTKPPSDVGVICTEAADCGTGLCVKAAAGGYCSRTCGTGDRCPANYHCTRVTGADQPVCMRVK